MRARNVLAACVAAAMLAGALIGLVETGWLAASAGLPDNRAPGYAVVLYGLLGGGFGAVVGVLAALVARRRLLAPGVAFALGFLAPFPMSVFIVRYVANKVVFAEQGVPLGWLAGAAGAALLAQVALGFLGLVGVFAQGRARGARHPDPVRPPLAAWALLAALGVAFALVPSGSGPQWGGRSPPGQGIVLILVDTLRADHVGAYGAAIPTPTLDALAADGIVFEQAFAAASWTRSSGASLLSSRIPSSHDADKKASRLSDDVVTLPEVLHEAGFHTGALINNINLTATFGFDQGFDLFLYEAPAYPLLASESVFGLAMYKVVHKLSERLLPGPERVERFYQPADVVLADAKRFLEENRGRRFALIVHLMEPHDPYFEHPSVDGSGEADYNGVGYARADHEHPDPEDAPYLARVYADEVVFLDRQLAPFFDWMRATGAYDDTTVVLTADHGEEFHEHGGFWHGTTLYDEQLHVPLLVKLAGGKHAGTRVPWQVRLIDVAPTVAALAGSAPHPTWEGRDLLGDVVASIAPVPVVESHPGFGSDGDEGSTDDASAQVDGEVPSGDSSAQIDDEVAPGESSEQGDADVDGRPAEHEHVLAPDPAVACEAGRRHPLDRDLIAEEDFEGNQVVAIRRDGFKLIRANSGNPRGLPERELFDVRADPAERADLLGSGTSVCGVYPPDRAAALDRVLGEVVVAARRGAVKSGTAAIDPAECERLKALGYVGADEDCG